ncbi:hypothetical protein QEZ40_006425 [Streptomyces katrae]|uniref:Uncharacterized protein n=1 Tax=Streptomyces katrae TaxID=68223 RepID=A0ABT7H3W7_9ACTN|nr:hypothetical protein [Streptomyces katrae]MDK9500597.1 hypothetical protein [Streptomyces katrae]
MGLDYGYQIYLPARNVARALGELTRLAPPHDRVPPLAVTLPGGERVTVPFTSGFKSEPVDCSAGGSLDLDTSIMFGADDAVRAYVDGRGLVPDGLGRLQVGYIYMMGTFESPLHPRHALLDFTAATSDMSRLFERSASIREVFTGLAAASGAVCCLLDTESETSRATWLNGRPVDEAVPGIYSEGFREFTQTWDD